MTSLARVALVAALCLAGSVQAVTVTTTEILELDQLHPDTTIGHAVPTGKITVEELEALNLLVWARNVTGALLSTVTSSPHPSADLDSIIDKTQSLIDPDFTVHACAIDNTGSCDIEKGPTESTNRYLDIILHYEIDAGANGVRIIVAEDAAKAVNIYYPMSFNVVVSALRLDEKPQSRKYLGMNLAPVDMAPYLDAEHLDWANSKLIDLIVNTTQSWPWKCSEWGSEITPSRVGDFESSLKTAIVDFEKAQPGEWSVSFAYSIRTGTGIAFYIQYALCGHLMEIAVVLKSKLASTSTVVV